MKYVIFFALMVTKGLLAESASSARVEYHFEKDGTRFSYDIPLREDTIRRVDGAIFSGSYLGLLEQSRVKADDSAEKKGKDRSDEVALIAEAMKSAIAPAKVGQLEVKSPDTLPALSTSGAADVTSLSLPKFDSVNQKLAQAVSDWDSGKFELAFRAMGELAPFVGSLDTATKEGLELFKRWTEFKNRTVSDGLLLLPLAGGKRALNFKTQKDKVEVRVLRHLANLSLLQNKGSDNEVWGLLVFIDEYAPAIALDAQAALAGGTGFAPVKAALLTGEAFQDLKRLLTNVNEELRPAVVDQIISDLMLKREVVWPGAKGMLIGVLNRLIAEAQ